MTLWFLDHLALVALKIGDALGGPFYRLERWANEKYRERRT